MGNRYAVAIGLPDRNRRAIGALCHGTAFDVADSRPGQLVIVERAAHRVTMGRTGLIIGAVHRLGPSAPIAACGPELASIIAASRGQHLVRTCWGNYVAVIARTGGGVDIVRAPMGSLPCLYARTSDGWIAGSDLDVLTCFFGFRPRISWDAVARFLKAPDVRHGETCLTDVAEVRGGDRLTLTATTTATEPLWSPWTFAAPDRQIEDPRVATRRLRDTILSSLAHHVAPAGRAVILLSGGLDSSIVAASAAAQAIDATCITVSTSVPGGDERRFAARTADRCGLALREHWFEGAHVDLTRSAAVGLPRPVARAFEEEGRRQVRLVAAEVGADYLLSGGGGDNVFCSIKSVTPAVDALRHFDNTRQFWRVSRELAQLTGASLLTVAGRAWRRSWQPARQHPAPADDLFLSAPARAIGATPPRHPWLMRPGQVLPGKGAHVASLLGVQAITEDTDPRDPLAPSYPLLAQPIVETCLRIPTWQWYDRGCNRAIARHAFENLLPDEIAWRRSKGTPDGFVVELYDDRRAEIRTMLREGLLASHGLLDVPAVTMALDDPRPVRGTDHGRIMRLVDVEAWARCWPA